MNARRLIMAAVVVPLVACGAPPMTSLPVEPPDVEPGATFSLPAADERLPVDAVISTDWEEAHSRLPAGFDVIEHHASDEALVDELYASVRGQFSGDLVPAVDVAAVERAAGRTVILLTSTGFGGEVAAGAQYLLVLLREDEGWRVDRTFHRFLCRVVSPDCGG